MSDRLRLPEIEAKPKEVELATSPLSQTVPITTDQKKALLAIIRAIEAGAPLPKGSYRTSKGRDILLETMGIMHLHLGRADSVELLYLIQYAEHVVLLEVGNHEHFGVPIGGKLDRDYGKAVITARERRRRLAWLKVQQEKD